MYPSLNPGAEIWGPSRFWGTLAFGYISQSIAILILFMFTLVYPQRLQRAVFPMEVTWLTPSQAPSKPPQVVSDVQPPFRPALQVAPPARTDALQLPAVEAPVILAARPATPSVLSAAVSAVPSLAPQPKLGTFAESRPVAAPGPAASQVQTGGFGDPRGLPGAGPGTGRLIAAPIGSFDMMQGEGYGSGTGGTKGLRSVVVGSGFSNPTPAAPPGGEARASTGHRVAQAGFGDVVPVLTIRPLPAPVAGPPVLPAVVTGKPTPAYTDEARRLRVEGEVVLEVMFPKSGKPQVVRILERLGHGLDESASAAVTKIEFKPAQQDGAPVDSKAIVRVVFKLA